MLSEMDERSERSECSCSHETKKGFVDSFFTRLRKKPAQNNNPLRFLLLLPEEDFRKCIYSKRDWIWFFKSNLPGILQIEKFEEMNSLPYTIEGIPMPRQLYIMLPKEKLFIRSNHFTARYIDSKMSELKQLFVLLRAKNIKFRRNIRHVDESGLGIQSRAVVPNMNLEELGAGLKVSSIEFRIDEQTNEMHFDDLSKKDFVPQCSIVEALNKASFYYLPRQFHWQNIIRRRVDHKLVYDRYMYKNQEIKLLRGKFIQKLKMLNIQADYDWKSMRDLEINYEIEYYPL